MPFTLSFDSQKYLPNAKSVTVTNPSDGTSYPVTRAQRYDHADRNDFVADAQVEAGQVLFTLGMDEVEGAGHVRPQPDWVVKYNNEIYTVRRVDSSEALRFHRVWTERFAVRNDHQ